ncbi:BQ2448_7630 [Microbotryum intermedium]|uniref:BQ2448_7630 protein n=1 Tax=Microbotryum intermedium TaxID=269621 RepID=A0A238FQX8_9BASI|nr:BQ2448_7630 [Microbotryum intermedium]
MSLVVVVESASGGRSCNAFHLESPFDQAFQSPSPTNIHKYLRMGSLVCRAWRPAFQRRLVSEVVLAGWRYNRPSPWPTAHKLLESGLGQRYPVDRLYLGLNPLCDGFATDVTEVFAGLLVRSLSFKRGISGSPRKRSDIFKLEMHEPVHWISNGGKDPQLSAPVLPRLEKLTVSSSDLPSVMDLSLNVEMPRLHHLNVQVDHRAYHDRTDLAKWADLLFGGLSGPRLRTLECSVLVGESDALQFLDAMVRHLPLCTSLENVTLEISHLERLGDCIRAVGSNEAPCRTLKIERQGEVDCKAPALSQLWSLLTSSLETDPWRHLKRLHIDLWINRLEFASDIPDLTALVEAAKQSRVTPCREPRRKRGHCIAPFETGSMIRWKTGA